MHVKGTCSIDSLTAGGASALASLIGRLKLPQSASTAPYAILIGRKSKVVGFWRGPTPKSAPTINVKTLLVLLSWKERLEKGYRTVKGLTQVGVLLVDVRVCVVPDHVLLPPHEAGARHKGQAFQKLALQCRKLIWQIGYPPTLDSSSDMPGTSFRTQRKGSRASAFIDHVAVCYQPAILSFCTVR